MAYVDRVGGHVRKVLTGAFGSSTAGALIALAMISATLSTPFATPGRAETRNVTLRSQSLTARSDAPLIVLVSLRKQKIRIFDDKGEITSSRISSGQPGFDTPTGVFSILEKKEHHESNIYEGAEMPFMQRITWSGIALHAGIVPGYRASHGCIRLPHSFAKSIFSLTKQGNRVIVTNDETRPAPIEHANLYRPLPAEYKDTAAEAVPAPAAAPDAKLPDTKVAVNTATATDGVSLPNYIGLANAAVANETASSPPPPAAEAAPPPPASNEPERPRSRAEAEKLAADKLAKLKEELKEAEKAKSATTDKAKAALRASSDAADKLAAEKKAASSAVNAVSDAEKRLATARAQFASFMRNPNAKPAANKQKRGDVQPPIAVEDREADFEDQILDATIELDRVRKDAADPMKGVIAAEAALKVADEAKAAVVAEVRDVQTKLRSAQTALVEANKDLARRNKPLSVLVSLKTERIYVRQGFEPVLEAPIAVDRTAGKVGTHVFTAMKYSEREPDKFEWLHVSAQGAAVGGGDDADDGSRKKKREAESRRTTGSVQQAMTALNAFEIPDDVLDLIMERARPGASLIVSDRALHSNENGPGTEFTLLTR